ncbi:MAG: restriction endonuclease subunit S [Patescibacteria group bacterium]|jgi:type I restriction enzyme S subunit
MSKNQIIQNGWHQTKLKDLGVFTKGSGILKSQLSSSGNYAIRYGELYTRHHIQVKNIHSYISDEVSQTARKIGKGDILFAGSGETIDEIGKSAVYLKNDPCYAGGDIIVFSPKNADSLFLVHLLNMGEARKKLRELGQGQAVVHLYKSDLENLSVTIPPLPEQRRIVSILETWDEAINELMHKINLKQIEKDLLARKLVTGIVRLPNFSNKWSAKRLGDLLDYEQPTKYLVKDTEYNEAHSVPVLTAGKTFVLGYTDENTGIFTDLPVIIFDDFTTANKFVTFPFKAKSSAMKMLKSKSNEIDLKFVFEKMQLLNFQPGEHKRYWISEYQEQEIEIPELGEQRAIANVLSVVDEVIHLLKKKLANLQYQKDYLLNALMTGVIRTPENLTIIWKTTKI